MKIKLLFIALFIFSAQQIFSQAPNWSWAKGFISVGISNGKSIAIDSNNDVYTTGTFEDTTDFDPGPGISNLTSGHTICCAATNTYISKLDEWGNFKWAKSLFNGSITNGYNKSFTITLDANRDVYIGGEFSDTVDFDPGAGIHSINSAGNSKGFILKLDSSGNFLWVDTMGGAVYSIVIDNSGNIYTSGNDSAEIFIRKLDSLGNTVWSKITSCTNNLFFQWGNSVTLDNDNHVYFSGCFGGTPDFDPGPGIFNLTDSTGSFFVSTFDSAGNFIWAKNFGGGTLTSSYHPIRIDTSGNVYAAGNFDGVHDFDPGSGTFNMDGGGTWGSGSYILKLDSSGNFIWALEIGLSASINSIVLDANANIYTTGMYDFHTDFDPGAGILNLPLWGSFILKLDSAGNFKWVAESVVQSVGFSEGNSIAMNSSGHIYITGWCRGDIDFGTTTFSAHSSLVENAFIAKLDSFPATGIEAIVNNNHVSIFPNPSSNHFTIALANHKKVEVTITDITGKIIYSTTIRETPQLEISTKDFAEGVYIVQVKGEEFVETKKILITNQY